MQVVDVLKERLKRTYIQMEMQQRKEAEAKKKKEREQELIRLYQEEESFRDMRSYFNHQRYHELLRSSERSHRKQSDTPNRDGLTSRMGQGLGLKASGGWRSKRALNLDIE